MNFGQQSPGTQLENIGNSIKNGVSNAVSGFSESTASVGNEFLQSNSIIAKFAFIILVILGFMVLLNLGIALLAYYYSPPPSPYLINGMIDGTNGMVIPQDPKNANSITILRSDNQSTGLEFTWSLWLFVTDPGTSSPSTYQNIFNKGNGIYNSITSMARNVDYNSAMTNLGINRTTAVDGTTTYVVPSAISSAINSQTFVGPNVQAKEMLTNVIGALGISNQSLLNMDQTGIASVNNGPGMYLVASATSASVIAVMDTVDPQNPTQTMKVDNCPINKWFHVALRMENNIMDIYINGTISGRTLLTGVPRQNYNDVNICQNGGFTGSLSNLRYYNKALSAFEINSVVRSGPNTTLVNSNIASNPGYSYYLADSWFYSKLKTM